ncbi:iron ABC transporter permease [Geomicrobium sp. JCM 19039]|uniref:FecCD family ABC transporter permease n=1 Tax=Geomicrobium sp. JCM 19039 TaxID=1460636 RepID=UPI00045F24AB|nr:iron ABC transporter permease [Geomicrobium sp. JCM 19039]GAK11068.1 ABC-type Fe3+-siderophore transport system, permease 2 component [Geomicrobium sp. JCM 19039]
MQKRRTMIISVLLIFIVSTFLVSMTLGTFTMSPAEVFQTFFGLGSSQQELVLFQFRLPRMVLAILVGAGLAVSGAILQALSRNDLADPGILGINAGAGLAIVLFIYFFQGSYADLGWSIYLLPMFAFLGALVAAFLIYTIAWKQGVTPVRLVLVGIGINAGFMALLIVFQLRMNPNDFMQATIWLTGNIWGSSWTYVLAIFPWLFVLMLLVLRDANTLNVMRLGDASSVSLGVRVEQVRRRLLVFAVGLAGASVAAGGAISFIGLVAPHIARRLVGPRHGVMIPVAALVGAFFLLFSDMIARNVLSPSEIPVGIIVAMIGAPYFLYLLMKTA